MMNIEAEDIFKLFDEYDEIQLRVQGNSMSPFLRNYRDSVILRKPHTIHKGDIVVFKYGKRYMLHRVIKIKNGCFDALGDNRTTAEKNVPLCDVVAKTVKVVRNGKRIGSQNLMWLFYSKIYIIPVIRKAIRKIWRDLNED